MKVAKERKSSVLESNAIHHRVDSLTGIAALLSIAVSNLFPTFAGMDSVGGLLISWLVVRAGWGNTLSALYELADRSIDDEVKRAVRRQAAKGLAEDAGVLDAGVDVAEVETRDVSGVKSGQNYLVDLELAVPGAWTVEQVRAVEDAVRHRDRQA